MDKIFTYDTNQFDIALSRAFELLSVAQLRDVIREVTVTGTEEKRSP